MRLFRIILPVTDIARAADFYSGILDQPGWPVSPGRWYFDCGGVILACYDPVADGDSGAPGPLPEPIYIATPQLEAVYERCQARGARFPVDAPPDVGPLGTICDRPWGERSFYIFDSFGNPVCFVDEATVFGFRAAPGTG